MVEEAFMGKSLRKRVNHLQGDNWKTLYSTGEAVSTIQNKSPFVSVIVVNYNGRKFVDGCLRSLCSQTYRNFEVIFVDNASTDGSAEYVEEISRQGELLQLNLKVIKSKRNMGYGGGVNLGIKHARGDYVALLNPDTYLDPLWLEELVRVASSNLKIGVFQSKIIYPDFRINTTGGLCDIYGFTACRGFGERNFHRYDESLEDFFYASGASMLIKRKVFEEIGLFDEKLFLYRDDVDICWRARLKGYSIRYVPTSLCIHFESLSLRQFKKSDLLAFYYIERNKIRVILKNYGLRNLIKRTTIALLLSLLSSIVRSVKEGNPYFIFMFLKGLSWNIQNLMDTFSERKNVQKIRKESDEHIDKYMQLIPFFIKGIKSIIMHRTGRKF